MPDESRRETVSLKLCPFCGGPAEKRLTDGPKRGFIGCFTCMIGLPFNVPYGDVEVAAWNTRADGAAPVVDAEWIAETTAREYVSKSLMPDETKLELSRNDYWQRAKGAETVLERIRAAAPPAAEEEATGRQALAAELLGHLDRITSTTAAYHFVRNICKIELGLEPDSLGAEIDH